MPYRAVFNPIKNASIMVDHFSLPAFDSGDGPERVLAGTIGSNKLVVRGSSVLVSRLNPGTNRTWRSVPSNQVQLSVCSTEYSVLEPRGISAGLLWAVVSSDDVADCLVAATTGTTASHQRVREDEVLGATVLDPRALDDPSLQEVEILARTMARISNEVHSLRTTLHFLLPRLLSGELQVAVAEEQLEEAS